jgi:hypothetical protein
MKRIPIKKTGLLLITLALATLLLTGCFWTPDDGGEGGISLNINTGGMSASSTDPSGGFFFAYVIAEDLLRGDQTAANQVYDELGDIQTDIYGLFGDEELEVGSIDQDLENYRVEISFPSIQVQAQILTGNSGTNTFRGLRADGSYLVAAIATTFRNSAAGFSYDTAIGFDTVTIKSGETQTVNLDVGNNWTTLNTTLNQKYGVRPDTTPEDVYAFPLFLTEQQPVGESQLYYDFIDATESAGNIDIGNYTEGSSMTDPGGLFTALNSAPLLDKDGRQISNSGQRNDAPTGGIIENVSPGMRVRLVLITNPDRGQYASFIGISDAFTVGYGSPLGIYLYPWPSREIDITFCCF